MGNLTSFLANGKWTERAEELGLEIMMKKNKTLGARASIYTLDHDQHGTDPHGPTAVDACWETV